MFFFLLYHVTCVSCMLSFYIDYLFPFAALSSWRCMKLPQRSMLLCHTNVWHIWWQWKQGDLELHLVVIKWMQLLNSQQGPMQHNDITSTVSIQDPASSPAIVDYMGPALVVTQVWQPQNKFNSLPLAWAATAPTQILVRGCPWEIQRK